jgi:hypothetical protein
VLVVMSDGRDEKPNDGTGQYSQMGRRAEAGERHRRNGLRRRARVERGPSTPRTDCGRDGGEAYFTGNASELEHHYRRILEELRRRYLVAYTSTNAARDGKWRKVEIRASATKVRSRGGYYAPPQ